MPLSEIKDESLTGRLELRSELEPVQFPSLSRGENMLAVERVLVRSLEEFPRPLLYKLL